LFRNSPGDPFSAVVPPIPTPQAIAESIRHNRYAKKALTWCVLLAVLVAIVRFGGAPAWRAVKDWRAQHLAAEALMLIDRENWTDATRKINSAFQLRQMNPEVWRANARLLSRVGRGAAAVEWWAKIAQTRPLSLQDRRDYASAALSANELGLAGEQIEAIQSTQTALTPDDLLLAGQLAALRGHNAQALEYAKRADADVSISPRNHLAANLLVLTAANQDSPDYVQASAQLIGIARSGANRIALEALAILAKQLSAKPPSSQSDQPLSIPLPQLSPEKHLRTGNR
jgi:hypothetical protein